MLYYNPNALFANADTRRLKGVGGGGGGGGGSVGDGGGGGGGDAERMVKVKFAIIQRANLLKAAEAKPDRLLAAEREYSDGR
ncbi:hypothetical protein M0802_013835 [Mischocyttarus mexicanus]|nr:hypothetical protein M0802_013835 [Mischocyttarus mexicanus]